MGKDRQGHPTSTSGSHTHTYSGKRSNQLFTAKGKYHLFFTLFRKKEIYLFKTVPLKLQALKTLPRTAKHRFVAPPAGLCQWIPICFPYWPNWPTIERANGQAPDCWEACTLAAGSRGGGLHGICINWPWGLRYCREKTPTKSAPPWAGEGTLYMTHMVHTQSEDKGWGLQMDLVPTETSPLKDTDGKMPLNHRKLFF